MNKQQLKYQKNPEVSRASHLGGGGRLWGGAFTQAPRQAVLKFTAGRDVRAVAPADNRLIPYDIWGSQAHAVMLYKTGIIDKEAAEVILKGLGEIKALAAADKFALDPQKEDVHSNIEAWLIEKYGVERAGKLHTARSRNDQINLDMRLYLREMAEGLVEALAQLSLTLVELAVKHKQTVMPGFTHTQHAMVTTWGHVLMAFAAMAARDGKRLSQWQSLHNDNPLGNSVAYGTILPIDQEVTSELLAFVGPEVNSLDTVTNRWEAEADLVYALSVMMNHLGALAQTLITLATPEFCMVKLADEFATGSSIMPQKKNPDPLELMRGKAGYAMGQLLTLLAMGKSNFIGYNRDGQWTKYALMDALDECSGAPAVVEGILETLTVNKAAMAKWADKGFIGATSLLEQLVAEYGLPFRQAKIALEKAVGYSGGQDEVTPEALMRGLKEAGLQIKIKADQVKAWQAPELIVKATESVGAPGPNAMAAAAARLTAEAGILQTWVKKQMAKKAVAVKALEKEIKGIIGVTND